MSHAPGPWKIDGQFDDGVDVGIIDANGDEILGISPMDGLDLDQWGERSLANAHLIAAAPDMLSSLRVIFELSRNGSSNVVNTDRRLLSIATECQQAIAKAEGRS